jgi:hypothetical protein
MKRLGWLFLALAAGCGPAAPGGIAGSRGSGLDEAVAGTDGARLIGAWKQRLPEIVQEISGVGGASAILRFEAGGGLSYTASFGRRRGGFSAGLSGRWSLDRGVLTISGLTPDQAAALETAPDRVKDSIRELEGQVSRLQVGWKNGDALILKGRDAFSQGIAPGRYDRLSEAELKEIESESEPVELLEPVRDPPATGGSSSQ